ncbi:MAG: hypothetical protein ACRED3_14760, partial [Bradyrhizobium sp.]
LYERLLDRIEELCRPSKLVSGRVSWFGDGITASGLSAGEHEGLALNLWPGTDAGYNNATTQKWMRQTRAGKPPTILVKLLGRSRYTTAIDVGPAGHTGRALDFSLPLVEAMGWSGSNFPTDRTGTAYFIPYGCR